MTQPTLVTAVDPSGRVAGTPGFYDGVAMLAVRMSGGNSVHCCGSLLGGGQYLSTAAHCVSDGSPTANAIHAAFLDGQMLMGESYFVAPGWTGSYLDGRDIAVVKLASRVAGIPGCTLYRDPDPAYGAIEVAGHGLTGTGGAIARGFTSGATRAGQNSKAPVGRCRGFPTCAALTMARPSATPYAPCSVSVASDSEPTRRTPRSAIPEEPARLAAV